MQNGSLSHLISSDDWKALIGRGWQHMMADAKPRRAMYSQFACDVCVASEQFGERRGAVEEEYQRRNNLGWWRCGVLKSCTKERRHQRVVRIYGVLLWCLRRILIEWIGLEKVVCAAHYSLKMYQPSNKNIWVHIMRRDRKGFLIIASISLSCFFLNLKYIISKL